MRQIGLRVVTRCCGHGDGMSFAKFKSESNKRAASTALKKCMRLRSGLGWIRNASFLRSSSFRIAGR